MWRFRRALLPPWGPSTQPYRSSTVELPSLADRYCHHAVATGEVSTNPPPFTCSSAVGVRADPSEIGWEKPEVGDVPSKGVAAGEESVGCWPLANVRKLTQSGEHSCTGSRFSLSVTGDGEPPFEDDMPKSDRVPVASSADSLLGEFGNGNWMAGARSIRLDSMTSRRPGARRFD